MQCLLVPLLVVNVTVTLDIDDRESMPEHQGQSECIEEIVV
jgi:hypothetical protein